MKKKEKEINIALIGAGGRSGLLINLLKLSGNIKIKSIFDPDPKVAEKRRNILGQPEARICKSYQEAINTKSVNWVTVFSPNAYHCEHIVAAFKAGKNVFSEKPLATTIEDCQTIFDAHKKSGLLFATGFVLRYAPLYNKVREILDAGTIGKILSIDANENIGNHHGTYIMMNWRRFSKISGPHILEKCCHDIDLLNWFVGSLPSRVASFGGRDLFTPENAGLKKKYRNMSGAVPFTKAWEDPHAVACPFKSEKDIVDNQVAILEYRNNVRVMFQATLSNAIPERRMYFSGTEGTMIAELYSGELKVRKLGADEPVQVFKLVGGGHAGGDTVIMEELYNTMMTGKEPKCSGEEGLDSSVTALAIDKSRLDGKIIDMEPVWKKLDR
ncbi:MAG: hypothetical protein A2017_12655 [Lentisphaerae bacterium GWF2_44_16]|nr:MAG: hypothetical protein A2017_12655 [Lentisphaerae bacterium GWF2_44_16]